MAGSAKDRGTSGLAPEAKAGSRLSWLVLGRLLWKPTPQRDPLQQVGQWRRKQEGKGKG